MERFVVPTCTRHATTSCNVHVIIVQLSNGDVEEEDGEEEACIPQLEDAENNEVRECGDEDMVRWQSYCLHCLSDIVSHQGDIRKLPCGQWRSEL